MELDLRSLRSNDVPFILSSWVHNQRYERMANVMGPPVWHKHQVPRIERYLDGALGDAVPASVRVLCLREDQDAILGWAAYHDDVLDYVYVKGAMRKDGHARHLVESIGSELRRCSHLNADSSDWFLKKLSLEYDPYAFGEALCPSSS